MTNPLITERDAFASRHPETRFVRENRNWGVIDTGNVETGANRPALLILPGTLGRGDVFFKQINALAPEVRVLAVSYPDSGKLASWIDDLTALTEARGLDRFAVLGTSLGGYIAQMFAAVRPAPVSHLFAANTLPSVAELDQRKPFSLDLWNAPIGELRDGFGDTLRGWRETHPDEVNLIDLLFAELNGRIPETELRARMDVLKGADELPPSPLPPASITVIDAADDPLIPPEWRARVRRQQNAGATFGFRRGGHFPYLARPVLYTAVIRGRLGLATLPAEWGTGPEHTA